MLTINQVFQIMLGVELQDWLLGLIYFFFLVSLLLCCEEKDLCPLCLVLEKESFRSHTR